MDKKLYKEADKLFEKELREIVDRGEIDPGSLELTYKILDNIKDISIICAMKKEAEEDEEYSERRYMYDDDMSYARGRGRYARRDSMGRYSRGYDYDGQYDDGGNSYERYSRRGYSRDDELDRMMSEAKTEQERELIRKLKEAKRG